MLQSDIFEINNGDIVENDIRDNMPNILDILLIDRTKTTEKKTHNIIWANENYINFGKKYYSPESPIMPEFINGQMGNIIKPSALKNDEVKKERTKSKAEVFTPTWVVKKQNDEVDKMYKEDDFQTYINRTWLEITCGEAPYMASRYDMETGEMIDLDKRVGFLDRKLKLINEQCNIKEDWFSNVISAYKSSYGFEWSGDSLLLARENLLFTFFDYYEFKWNEFPTTDMILEIAIIISYNVFQMDGLKFTIPLSEKKEKIEQIQMLLFDDFEEETKVTIKKGKRVKIMNWEINKMEYFDKGVN